MADQPFKLPTEKNPLRKEWEEFEQQFLDALPSESKSVARKTCRTSFYSGAVAVMNLLRSCSQDPAICAYQVGLIDGELLQFGMDLKSELEARLTAERIAPPGKPN